MKESFTSLLPGQLSIIKSMLDSRRSIKESNEKIRNHLDAMPEKLKSK